MGRRSFDRASRWPWGVWFALVGVSAGTVASFALVGWVFVSASGQGGASGAAGAPGWADEAVVLEATPGATPEAASVPRPDPSVDRPRVNGPEAERETDPVLEASSEPEPGPEPETEAGRLEESGESGEDPRLVPLQPLPPLEERQECERPERPEYPELSPSDRYSTLAPGLEHEDGTSPRSMG